MKKGLARIISSKLIGRSVLLSLCLFFTAYCHLPTAYCFAQEGVRTDLPLGGELRVVNRHGGVRVEVWKEKFVSVTAQIEGARPARSPVVIERTEQLLSIGVAAQETSNPSRVDLILNIPKRTKAEIITSDGAVDLTGVPASLSVESELGDIRANFSQASNATVTTTTESGKMTAATNCLPASARDVMDDHQAVCRIGAGGNPVRLRSKSGRITLVSAEAAKNESASPEERKAPMLIGATGNEKGAGTPATDAKEAQEVSDDDVVRVDTELVTVNVSVVDRASNRGLVGLTQNDFKIYEDRGEQQIAHFESSSAPFNLVLLIDLSGSTREVVNLIRAAALRFVAAARPNDRIAVITFADTPVVVSTLTSDRELLRQRINSIEQPKGSTKLYDSVAFALDEVLKESKDTRRNAIVLMSDGLDSVLPNVEGEGSKLDYKDLLWRVREFDGVIYSLWLNTEYESLSDKDIQPETFDLAHDRLVELAETGGGVFYEVEKLEDLAGAYERVVADLGTVYSLSYKPMNTVRDGKWRMIRVAVSRPNSVARGKRGYYAK